MNIRPVRLQVVAFMRNETPEKEVKSAKWFISRALYQTHPTIMTISQMAIPRHWSIDFQ